jgi:hypothetical protein
LLGVHVGEEIGHKLYFIELRGGGFYVAVGGVL